MMKKIFFLLPATGMFMCYVKAQQNLKLWYDKPAKFWTEALPIGNGRLGAMVFGKVGEELIQLNESTLWSGGPVKTNVNPDAPKFLPQLRKALMDDEDYETAIALSKKMQGPFTESYMPFGDIIIKQNFKDTTPSSYYRDLNISNAVSTTKFTADGTEFTREIFSSAPNQVIIIRLTCNKPNQLNFLISAKSLLHYQLVANGNDELTLKGKAPAHVDPSYYNPNKEPVIYEDTTNCNGMRFQLSIKAVNKGGTVTTDTFGIKVSNASEVILFVSAATSFNGFDKCPDKEGKDENKIVQQYINKATTKTYEVLLQEHLNDYHKYFDRCSFILSDTSNNKNTSLPSDERLRRYTENKGYDPGIEILYFQYGRYLLISSSRPGGTPANLQGIWNKEVRPPWSSNFTININTQMNYWPAEVTNLSEMHEPLFALIKQLSVTGKTTAQQFYNMHGWVAHHNTDIWALSNPVGNKGGDPRWANWAQGGNWLCQHLWDHYLFTGDKTFLKQTAYPLMKGAAIFCLNWLVKDSNGYLVVAPSVSPENVFRYAKDKVSDVSVATTMDMQIVWDLFTNLINASKLLNVDAGLRAQLIANKNKLYPLHIGKKGNLQEWNKDWDDVEVHHRHVSHLFGLHPGHQISPVTTPQFAEASKKTLEIRGDEGTGWSKAWKINFWARLLDGNHAYKLLRDLLHATSEEGTNYAEGGGTYPNFFDAHPPFQIDGNFGGTAGITEMLLQSTMDEIFLLPALPDAWQQGAVKGLKARGAFEVDINWNNKNLTDATIKAIKDGTCKIRTMQPFKVQGISTKAQKSNIGYTINFVVQKGKTYHVSAL